ncbi:hypothetical protein PM082_018337 [Marasmius tenuissimus]|nr:hypothetical protein PM082_018337 [Marasmius tenuissimus]
MDDLPNDRIHELLQDQLMALRRSERLKEQRELKEAQLPRDIEVQELREHEELNVPTVPPPSSSNEDDPTVFESRIRDPALPNQLSENSTFENDIKQLYSQDARFKKILDKPDDHKPFTLENDLLRTKNRGGETVLCIPKRRSSTNGQSLKGLIIEQAHRVVGHFGEQRTSDYVRPYLSQRNHGNPLEWILSDSSQNPKGLTHQQSAAFAGGRSWPFLALEPFSAGSPARKFGSLQAFNSPPRVI